MWFLLTLLAFIVGFLAPVSSLPVEQIHPTFAFWNLAVPLITSGVSALGGLLANRKRQQDVKSSWSSTATTTPQEDPRFAGLFEQLMKRYTGGLDVEPFMGGYEAQGLQANNQAFGSVQQALANRMASAGLFGGPMGEAANLNLEMGRAGQAAQFLQGIPLLKEQLMQQRLNEAMKFWAMRPMGSSTAQSGTGTNIQTIPGNMAGGAFTSGASMLAYLYGLGAFDGAGGGGGGSKPAVPAYPKYDWRGNPIG